MSNVTVTILQSGRTDDWGRPLVAGNSYSLDYDRAKSLWQAGIASVADPDIFDDSNTFFDGGIVRWVRFPGFRRSLLASLVANSTASRTNGLVTIAATAHGIPTGATYQGYRFFYPGSTNLVAGWYDSIVEIATANSLSFSAPGPDFASESINGAAAYTTLTDVASAVLPGSLMVPEAQISVIGYRGGDTTATSKGLRTYLNGLNVHTDNVTSTSFVRFTASTVLADIVSGKAFGHGSFDNLSSGTEYLQSVPLRADTTVLVKASIGAAGSFLYIPSMKILLQ